MLCYGRGARYAPAWSASLDAQLAAADFPARRIDGPRAALTLGREYDAVIAPFAGGSMLPAAYVGAKRFGTPFVLWASVWHQPRSVTHALALPVTRHIYRHADAVIAYGEHVRRFAAQIRGRDDDIFIAPQAVERDLFGRHVDDAEIAAFRAEHELGDGPLVLYTGRLVAEKGLGVLAEAWPQVTSPATLVLAGDGPYAEWMRSVPGARLLGPIPRAQLVVAYAAAQFTVVPSIPTPRFKEPWGLVCNEAFEQGRTVIATTAVGAAAGGLVRDGEHGPRDRAERLAPTRRGDRHAPQRRHTAPPAGRRRHAPPYSRSPTRRWRPASKPPSPQPPPAPGAAASSPASGSARRPESCARCSSRIRRTAGARSICPRKTRSRSSPVSSVAVTSIVSVPTSICASGCALRLWYQAGFSGAPPLEAKMK